MITRTFDPSNIKTAVLGINSWRDVQMHCRQVIRRYKFCAILLLALIPLAKEINMHLAMVMGLGNAGGSHGPLAWQGQMAALALPYGKPDHSGS